MSAPTDRRWRDPRGTRRASVEFGGKSPGRKPREKRRQATRHEGRGARLGRRLRTVRRFGVKHRGSLTCVVGSIGAAVSLIAFEGVVQLVSVAVSLIAVGVGGAVHHHQKSRLLHRNPNVTTPTWSERARFEQALRTGKPYEPQGGGPVHVSGSDRAQSHTRARPGQAKAT